MPIRRVGKKPLVFFRLGGLDFFAMQMAAINRKQVPLCRVHHVNLHRNTLSEWERLSFTEGCKRLVSARRPNLKG